MPAARSLPVCWAASAVSARSSRSTAKNGKSPCLFPARTRRHQAQNRPWPWACTHGRPRPCQSLHQPTSRQGAEPLFFSRLPGMGKLDPMSSSSSSRHEPFLPHKRVALSSWRNREMRFSILRAIRSCWLYRLVRSSAKKLLTGKGVQPGDTLIALPSAGLHTNGYSLARKLVFESGKAEAGHVCRESE